MKYRVRVRGQKGDYDADIECDMVAFQHSWWVVFIRDVNRGLYVQSPDGPVPAPPEPRIVAAFPSEHVNQIALLEGKVT